MYDVSVMQVFYAFCYLQCIVSDFVAGETTFGTAMLSEISFRAIVQHQVVIVKILKLVLQSQYIVVLELPMHGYLVLRFAVEVLTGCSFPNDLESKLLSIAA